MRIIEVIDYDPVWREKFEAERKMLGQILSDVAIKIHHIGSTAVPGLAAKPIIDILMEVTSLEALDRLNPQMISKGYEPRGEYGIAGRRYFIKGGEDRTHHIHAFARGDFNLVRHLAFRDYLRIHPRIAWEYGELKKKIAKNCRNNMERYCNGKDDFVKKSRRQP